MSLTVSVLISLSVWGSGIFVKDLKTNLTLVNVKYECLNFVQ